MKSKSSKAYRYDIEDCAYLNKKVAIKKEYSCPKGSDTQIIDKVSCNCDVNCNKSGCQMIGGEKDYIGTICV